MTYGELALPLGSTRLNIIKLIAKLIGTNNSKLNEEIVHFNIFNTILVRKELQEVIETKVKHVFCILGFCIWKQVE